MDSQLLTTASKCLLNNIHLSNIPLSNIHPNNINLNNILDNLFIHLNNTPVSLCIHLKWLLPPL